MENKEVKKARTRKGSRAESSFTSTEEEMAPNMNGDKDGGSETENATNAPKEAGEDNEQKLQTSDVSEDTESLAKGTKRKLSELEEEEIVKDLDPPTKENDESSEVSKNNSMEVEDSTKENILNEEDEAGESLIGNDTLNTTSEMVSLTDKLEPINQQSLGKGKRARVPNKRYSDIPSKRLSDNAKTKLSENGQVVENEIDKQEPEADVEDEPTKRPPYSSPVPHTTKKLKSVDLSNPCFLKPFKLGWKRELVYRSTSDNSLKRNGDIYYYTPNGKKVRSMREVSDNLSKELSLDDFTFCKEPLGIADPEKEIIRAAKIKASAAAVAKKPTPKVQKPPARTRTRSPKASLILSPVTGDSTKSVKSPKRSGGAFKVKVPKTTPNRRAKKTPSSNMEIGTYPPNWTSPTRKGKSPRKTLTGKGKPATKASKQHSVTETTVEVSKITDSYLQNLAYGYQTLLHVFQYLKVQDLLRAGCVCTMWSDVARHPILWNTVRMKNSQIHSFEGLANALLKHGTVHLDLRKMLLPTTGGDDIWPSFTTAIKKVESLRKIELCRCLAAVVEDLARNNHNLEAINAVTIKCESMTFEPFSNLKNLTDLRLKSTTGLSLTSDLSALKELTKLKHLSITSIKDLYQLNIEVIADLVNIEVLDLGECSEFPKHFGPDILSKLVKLEKLRLEKGQGECYTFDILNAVKDIKTLTQLELVNFDIKTGFDKALGSCVNIKKLLMIPTYISQSATTNHMVLGGVLKLQKTLSHFVWGVTLELLRVTELFVDQCEQPDKREVSKDKNITSGDSIPVLKPVPLHGMPQSQVFMGNTDTPQVEILPLPNLQKLLLQNLPSTRVKILKIPFHATWRQTITDSV